MAVWTPLCHHLQLRWSDKWDFNWVFRLSNIRRWDRIIQEHINVIKSSQIWQLYCIRKLPALLLFSPVPPMPIRLKGLLLWAALTWLTLIAGSNYRINPNIIKLADMEAKTWALTVLAATYVWVMDAGGKCIGKSSMQATICRKVCLCACVTFVPLDGFCWVCVSKCMCMWAFFKWVLLSVFLLSTLIRQCCQSRRLVGSRRILMVGLILHT